MQRNKRKQKSEYLIVCIGVVGNAQVYWRFLGVAEHQMTLDNEHKEREE